MCINIHVYLCTYTHTKIYTCKYTYVYVYIHMQCVTTEDDNDMACIDYSLKKTRSKQNSVTRILNREGVNAKFMENFYVNIA